MKASTVVVTFYVDGAAINRATCTVGTNESYDDAIHRVARRHYGLFNCHDGMLAVRTHGYVTWVSNYYGKEIEVVGMIDNG